MNASRSPRPIRCPIVASVSDLLQILAVTRDRENLRRTCTRGDEREMPSIGRKRGTLVAAFAVGQLPALACRDVVDADVESRSAPRRIRDLVVRSRRPGGAVRVGVVERQTPLIQS